jgi:uncharacterized protein
MLSQFILKITSRCNLNCTYCYVYNKEDQSWSSKPPVMSGEVFNAAISRIKEHAARTGQDRVIIIFHGGEPCLVGVSKFAALCETIRTELSDELDVTLVIQTNGTLLNREWAACFARYRVDVGLSMDGLPSSHDQARIDHQGRGSYGRTVSGLRLLQDAGIQPDILCVIPFGIDPLAVHRHFLDLGCQTITYLLPHYTHDNIAGIRRQYGLTPCADFLIPIFDDWWNNSTMEICVRDLKNVARLIMGGTSMIETYGGQPAAYVIVETNGAIEGLDSLRACADDLTNTGLTVLDSGFERMHEPGRPMPNPSNVPLDCSTCAERDTCGGGYLPHRFSRTRGFDNPSVWCSDILKLFGHVRNHLNVSVDETHYRRASLQAAVSAPSPHWPVTQNPLP